MNKALPYVVPCVVSKAVGFGPDLVEPGATGEVCETGSITSLTAALRALGSAVPDGYCVVVGEGDGRGQLESLAVDTRGRDHVLFVGTKAGEGLAGYYHACDVFVMPSRTEGFGVGFLEPMSHGKPVVAANSGGVPEVVKDGVTGLLVEYEEVPALACNLTRLLTDRDCRHRMREAGRPRVEEQFTFEQFRTRLETLLTKAARSR